MLMAVLLPFLTIPRSNKPDPEKGEHSEASPEPDTRPPNEFDDLGNEYDEDDDLDTGPDPDDIRNDMEAERDETTEDPPPQERRRSYSSSFTLVAHDKPKPNWYRRLRDFISPKTTQEDLEAYVPNYRYTPILSGIVIPFSILLEIPGLTEHWYIRTVDNKIVENRSNPLILNIGLGFSMACALAANICLVARFLEKKVKVMTIGCCIFLTIHDVINVIAVTTFGVEHRFNDGFTYGQSFWITVCSTIVSTFTNFTLITDLIRTPDFENSGSGLTRRQKSLVIIVILLLSYIALGALIYSFLLHLNFIDAMYFTLVSIETIGFGDIQPRTTGARLFTCIYAAFGIVGIALTVSLTRETVLEGLEVGYRKRVQLVRQRRKIGRWKRRVSVRWREAIEWRLRESGFPVWVRDANQAHNGLGRRIWDFLDRLIPWPTGNNPSFSYGSGFMLGHGLGYGNHPHGMHLNLEALSWNQLEAAAMEAGVPLDMLLPDGFRDKRSDSDSDGSSHQENRPVGPAPDADVPLTHARLGRMIAMLGSFALAVRSDPVITHHTPRVPNSAPIPQFRKSLTAQYDALRSGVEKEETKAFYARLVVVWALFIMFWTIGSVIFMQTEGWSFGVSLYFCFVAFTTIGYGDYSPQTPAGRSVFVAWALLGVATMTILISVISEAFSSHYHSILHAGIFQRAVKRYREQAHVLAEKTRRRSRSLSAPRLQSTNQSAEDILNEVHTRTQTQLETLPHKILADAKTFHEHLSYFVGANKNVNVNSTDELPPGIVHLMKEITGAQKIGERIKREILQDDDARHTLFTLAIEQALRKMINSAEDAIQALEERERLLQQRENEASQGDNQDESDNQDATPTQEVTSATFASTLLARDRGRYFPRWDTSTSSEYSDWR